MKEKNILRKIADVIVAELGLSKEDAKLMQVKLEQMKLTDGVTIIEADSFEPEMEVMIVTEDQRIPLPKGEYELEDGRMLIVSMEGMISEIREMEVKEEVVVEEEVVASTEAPIAPKTEPKKVIETSTKEMHFSAEEFEALKAENKSLKAKLAETEVKLSEVVNPINYNPEKQNTLQIDLTKTDSKTRITNELNNLIK